MYVTIYNVRSSKANCYLCWYRICGIERGIKWKVKSVLSKAENEKSMNILQELIFHRSLQKCDVNIKKCQRLIKENMTYHEVLESLYHLDVNDRKFCDSENVNTFHLKQFFTYASRAIHDSFFVPSPIFMIGLDVETFDKLKKYYQSVVKVHKEKNGSKNTMLTPTPDRVPHMGVDFDQYQCFCPAKEVIPLRKRLPIYQGSYGAVLRICQQAHQIHDLSVNLVAQHAEDLSYAQKCAAYHQLLSDDQDSDVICVSEKEEDVDVENFPNIRALEDHLEDLEFDSDMELDLDDEIMDIPNASDAYIDLVKKQAAVTDCFAVLGFSALQSSETSTECQVKYQQISTFEKPKRSRTSVQRFPTVT
uniref:Uncharacterized protein n=1 Tax=Panagrolaimus superbus TaxID=310955 RepID=A0A914Y8X2_9BILA